MAVLPLQTNMSKTLFAQVGFLRILDMLFTIICAFKRYQVYLGTIFFRVEPYVSWTIRVYNIFRKNKNTKKKRKKESKGEKKKTERIKNGPEYQKIKNKSFCILLHINRHHEGTPIKKSRLKGLTGKFSKQ